MSSHSAVPKHKNFFLHFNLHILRHRNSGTDDNWAATGCRRPQLNISNYCDLHLPEISNYSDTIVDTNDCLTAKSFMFISAAYELMQLPEHAAAA